MDYARLFARGFLGLDAGMWDHLAGARLVTLSLFALLHWYPESAVCPCI